MDYLENLVQIGNVTVAGDTATFIYQIDPTNTVYGSDAASDSMIRALKKTIATLYKQGAIYLVPKKINTQEKLAWIEKTHIDNPSNERQNIYQEFFDETKQILSKDVIYTHDIYFTLVTGRAEMRHKTIWQKVNETVFSSPPYVSKEYQKNLMQLSDHFLFEISRRFKVRKISLEEAQDFYQYLVKPVYKKDSPRSYYVNPQEAEQLEYIYTGTEKKDVYYMRTYFVQETKLQPTMGKMITNLISKKQPVLITIKFDPRASQKAVEKAELKVEEQIKEQKKYQANIGRKSRQIDKGIKSAKLAALVFDDPQEIEMLTQIFIRVEGRTVQQLNGRASNINLTLEDSHKVKANEGIGKQHLLMLNTIPFLNLLQDKKSILNFNLNAFVDLQPFAGMKIGMNEGIPITYTHGKGQPVFYDFIKPFKGETTLSAPGVGIVGASGGGKSELVKYLGMMLFSVHSVKILEFDPKGSQDQREKIPGLQGMYQKIVLGTDASTRGIFDPLLRFKDNPEVARESAKKDLRFIYNALDVPIKDAFLLDEAIMSVQNKYAEGKIERPSMTALIDELLLHDKTSESWLLGRNLKHGSTMPLVNLFFANSQTKTTIDFEKYPYTVIQFTGMPKIDEFDEKDMEHIFASYVLGKCNTIADDFARKNSDKLKAVVVEEYGLFKKTPQGKAAVESMLRLFREFLGIPFIVSQNMTDFGENLEAIMNNMGALFIGNINSKTEIDFIIKELELEDNDAIRDRLRKKGENDSEDDKYVFLFVDHNLKKAFVKNKQYNMFKKYFDTSANKTDVDAEVIS